MNLGTKGGNGMKETNITNDAQHIFRQVGKRFYLETPLFCSFVSGSWLPGALVRDGNLSGEPALPLLHLQNRAQKGKHHLHVRLQQLEKHRSAIFCSRRCLLHMSCSSQRHRVQIGSYLAELNTKKLKAKPNRKT